MATTSINSRNIIQDLSLDSVTIAEDAPTSKDNYIKLFYNLFNNRGMAGWMDDNGTKIPLQPHVANFTSAISVVSAHGMGLSTTGGFASANWAVSTGANQTATGVTIDTSNLFKSIRRFRLRCGDGSASGQVHAYRGTQNMAISSTSAGHGGVFFIVHCGVGDHTANMRGFVGLRTTTSTMSNTSITGQGGFGFYFNSGDTQWGVYTRASATTSDTLGTGSEFPCDTEETDWYRMAFFMPPGQVTNNYWYIKNLSTGAEDSGLFTDNTWAGAGDTANISTQIFCTNGATATVVGIDISSLYFETLY